MEVLVVVLLLLVPVVAVVALFMALFNLRRIKALKELVATLVRLNDRGKSDQEKAFESYVIGGM